ncbi:MAG: HupE/UreJ family protein [Parvibaculales bacterium]
MIKMPRLFFPSYWPINLWLFGAIFFALLNTAQAHETRPAYLNLTEKQAEQFALVWKQPVKDNARLSIKPVFDIDCAIGDSQFEFYGQSIAEIATLTCPLQQGTIYFKGLESTLTDTYVTIDYLDGTQNAGIVKPDNPVFNLTDKQEYSVIAYLELGIEHIFEGWDHLAFVVGLILIVPTRRLWLVVTGFTLAHSITLAGAVFNILTLPARPVEILIAMSIVWLAYEASLKNQPSPQKTVWHDYAISFGFGLIHGFGFAGVLSDLGLPENLEWQALLLFNLGIELGQILFILCILTGVWLYLKTAWATQKDKWRQLAPYALGGLGSFWVIERLTAYVIGA